MAHHRARSVSGSACSLAVAVLLIGDTRAARAHEDDAPEPPRSLARIRTADASLLSLISDAVTMSATFARLVTTIEQSDGLVYLSIGACPEHTRACLLMQIDRAGPSRMLRIRIPAGKPDVDAFASIGHELQHAVEILGDSRVRTTKDLFVLYQRIALDPPSSWLQHRTRFRFETAAALRAGELVRQEVLDSRQPTH